MRKKLEVEELHKGRGGDVNWQRVAWEKPAYEIELQLVHQRRCLHLLCHSRFLSSGDEATLTHVPPPRRWACCEGKSYSTIRLRRQPHARGRSCLHHGSKLLVAKLAMVNIINLVMPVINSS